MAIATGQITLVDLYDDISLQGFLTSTQPKIQFCSNTGGSQNPSWVSNKPIITAEIYRVGDGTDIIKDTTVIKGIRWYYKQTGATSFTQILSTNSNYTINSTKEKLTINTNIMTTSKPALAIRCEIDYKHNDLFPVQTYKLDLEYSLSVQGATGSAGTTGKDGLTIILSNESTTISCDKDGLPNVGWENSTINEISVYQGTTKLTAYSEGTVNLSDTQFRYSLGYVSGGYGDNVGDGCTARRIDNKSFRLSDITKDNGSIIVTVSTRNQTVTKLFNFAKSKSGDDGAGAKIVELTTDSQAFSVSKTGTISPAKTTVRATVQNITATSYVWKYSIDGGVTWANLVGSSSSMDITGNSSMWGSSKTMTVKVEIDGQFDLLTLYKVTDGSDGSNGRDGETGITALLSNESVTVKCDNAGTPATGWEANTLSEVLVYKGSTKLTGTTGTPTTSQFKIALGTATGCTAEIVNAYSVRLKTLTADNGRLLINITTNGQTLTKVLSFSKSMAGADGVDGTDGAGAKSVDVTATSQIININEAGTPSPSSIVLTATTQNITSTTYAWYYSTNGTTFTLISGQTTNKLTVLHNASYFTGKSVAIKCTIDGVSDVITLSKVSDGVTPIRSYIWTPQGSVFKNSNSTDSLKATMELHKNGASMTATSYQWYYQDSAGTDDSSIVGTGWKKCVNTANGFAGATTKELTVYASKVLGVQTFKCKAVYDGVNYMDTTTFIDQTDPFQVEVTSTAGNIFKNNVGSTNVTLKLYKNGVEVDTAGTTYGYKWIKYDKNGSISSSSWATTKNITVRATDVDERANFLCEIRNSSSTLLARAEFSCTDITDIIASVTPPTNPYLNQVWIDTSKTPNEVKTWNGTEWVIANDFTVGGVNMLPNTNFENTNNIENGFQWNVEKGDLFELANIDADNLGFKYAVHGKTDTAKNCGINYSLFPKNNATLLGKTLSLGCWVKYKGVTMGSNNWNRLQIGKFNLTYIQDNGAEFSDSPVFLSATGTSLVSGQTGEQWIRYEGSLTLKDSGYKSVRGNISFRLESCVGEFWITGIKLEEGHKCTPWTPSYNDTLTYTDEKVNSAKSEIVAEIDNISLRVTEEEKHTQTMNGEITSLKTWKEEADIKISSDGIVNTVKNHKTNGEYTMAQTSQVKQMVDKVSFDFSSAGGFNMIKNSSGLEYILNFWYGGTDIVLPKLKSIIATNNKITSGYNFMIDREGETSATPSYSDPQFVYTARFKLKPMTKYTISGKFKATSRTKGVKIAVLTSEIIDSNASGNAPTYDKSHILFEGLLSDWTEKSLTFDSGYGTKSGVIAVYHKGMNPSTTGTSDNMNRVYWADLMLTEGEVVQQWSPHPSETYGGNTIIDSSGVTVNNGAFKINNRMGDTVFISDSKGDLNITGGFTASARSGGEGARVDVKAGGVDFITYGDTYPIEKVASMKPVRFDKDKNQNGLAIHTTELGDYVMIGYGNANGSVTPAMMFVPNDYPLAGLPYNNKGIHVTGDLFYSRSGFAIKTNDRWHQFYDTSDGKLVVAGDNGINLCIREGSSNVSLMRLVEHGGHRFKGEIEVYTDIKGNVANGIYNFNNIKTLSNTATRTYKETYSIDGEYNQTRILLSDMQTVNGQTYINIPNAYCGQYDSYVVSSLVKKGRGDIWVETEEVNRILICSENDIKFNVEITLRMSPRDVAVACPIRDEFADKEVVKTYR